jgi:3-methyladenine DNA glycosylase/8-oxoguanine DNA glycosylase
LPTSKDIIDIADRNNWHPYESIASWYIWKSLDNTSTTQENGISNS